MRFSNPWQFFHSIKFTPRIQTAGFGVFAGRTFSKDEVVIRSWMTLFLPKNLPDGLSIWQYCFGYNKTHVTMPLDYGSILNHHKSSNTYVWPGPNNNMHFQVRGSFQCTNHHVLKICTCMHACIHVQICAANMRWEKLITYHIEMHVHL